MKVQQNTFQLPSPLHRKLRLFWWLTGPHQPLLLPWRRPLAPVLSVWPQPSGTKESDTQKHWKHDAWLWERFFSYHGHQSSGYTNEWAHCYDHQGQLPATDEPNHEAKRKRRQPLNEDRHLISDSVVDLVDITEEGTERLTEATFFQLSLKFDLQTGSSLWYPRVQFTHRVAVEPADLHLHNLPEISLADPLSLSRSCWHPEDNLNHDTEGFLSLCVANIVTHKMLVLKQNIYLKITNKQNTQANTDVVICKHGHLGFNVHPAKRIEQVTSTHRINNPINGKWTTYPQ